MKRPIIFRGKRIDNGEWIYGSLVINGETDSDYYIFVDTPESIRVAPKTIGQYIGMEDIKTIAVYEDDIVRDYVSGVVFSVVFTDYGNFGLRCINPIYKDHEYETVDPSYVSTTLRVIGNIHENITG